MKKQAVGRNDAYFRRYCEFLFDFIAVMCYTYCNFKRKPRKTIMEICFFPEVSESRCLVRTGMKERVQSHS